MFLEVLYQLLRRLPEQFDFGAEAVRLVVLRLNVGLAWSDELALLLRGCGDGGALAKEGNSGQEEEKEEEEQEEMLLEPSLEVWTLQVCPLLFFADSAENQKHQQQPSTMSETERLRATVGKLMLKVRILHFWTVFSFSCCFAPQDFGPGCCAQGHVAATGDPGCPAAASQSSGRSRSAAVAVSHSRRGKETR